MDFTHFSNSVQPACPVYTHRAQQALGLLDGSTAAEETDQHDQTSCAYQDVHTWSSRDSRQPLISYINGESRLNEARCKNIKYFYFHVLFCIILIRKHQQKPVFTTVVVLFPSPPQLPAKCSFYKGQQGAASSWESSSAHLRSGRLFRLMVKLALKANLLLCLAEQSRAWAVSDQFKICLFKRVPIGRLRKSRCPVKQMCITVLIPRP